MTVAAITSEIQKLAPSSVIELFVLDLALFGQGPVRFHAGTNALQQRVVWQGNAYEAFPIEIEGFEFNGNGQVPRPRLRVANVIWRRELGDRPMAVLSGPNLADELDRGLPAASVIASRSESLAALLQAELRTSNLRLYTNNDPIGTEAAGALKNVIALAAGISDGLGLGANARASLLCRGLAEIGVVLEAMGGQTTTLYGLAGLGDLLATATSSLSRNQRFGTLLAAGLDESEALARIGATVEGPRTARATLALAQSLRLRLPICEQVVRLLAREIDAQGAVRALMERDPRPEVGHGG